MARIYALRGRITFRMIGWWAYLFVLALRRNRTMHSVNGNSVADGSDFSVVTINSNGVNAPGKFMTLCGMQEDVVAICETHATDKTQKVLNDTDSKRQVFWGEAVGTYRVCSAPGLFPMPSTVSSLVPRRTLSPMLLLPPCV